MTSASQRRAVMLEIGLVGAVAAAFVLTAAIFVAKGPPFTWDEAVYALTSRHWLDGTPSTGWGPHRSPVLSALGTIPVALGLADEAAFRIIGLVSGAGLIAATWFLARSLAGPVAGIGAALAVAAAPALVTESGFFLTDVPSTAVLLALVALLWRAMERPDGPGRDLLWLAPIAAAAFYVRYGSILPLAALAVVAAVLWPDRLVRARWTVLGTLALTTLLVVPHAIFSTLLTGSPLGIALAAQSGARPAFTGESLVAYLGLLSGGLAGIVPGLLMLAGLAACAVQLARRRVPSWDRTTRALVLLVLTALVQLGVMGLFILPQVRYVFFAITLLIVAGCVGLAELLRRRGAIGRLALVGIAAALVVSLAVNPFVVGDTADRYLAQNSWERELGTLIGQAAGQPCSVLATDVPQITWYSGCYAYNFGNRATEGDRDHLLVHGERFMVVRADGRFQPEGELMAGYLARVEPEPMAVVRRSDDSVAARLYRFR